MQYVKSSLEELNSTDRISVAWIHDSQLDADHDIMPGPDITEVLKTPQTGKGQ